MLCVPDASVAIKWFLREEHSENSRVLLSRILSQVDRAVAPDLLATRNRPRPQKEDSLRPGYRGGLGSLEDLNAVPIEWVPVQPLLDAILIEALARKISVYDMTYLDVARRHNAVVVTADDGLAASGARENLAIHVRDYHP